MARFLPALLATCIFLGCGSGARLSPTSAPSVAPEPPPIPRESMDAAYQSLKAAISSWSRKGETSTNDSARKDLIAKADAYHRSSVHHGLWTRESIEAAYWSAAAREAVSHAEASSFWKKTIVAYERWKSIAPKSESEGQAGAEESEWGAEAEFTLVDRAIWKTFDYETGHCRYSGSVTEIVRSYTADAKTAKTWFDALERVIHVYATAEWGARALARQGSLYDSLRTGLYSAKTSVFDEETLALLDRAEKSNDPDLIAKAAEVRGEVDVAWRTKRERELTSADKIMLNRYVSAYVVWRHYGTSRAGIAHALERLRHFTNLLGNEKLREYTAGIDDFAYEDDMFTKLE